MLNEICSFQTLFYPCLIYENVVDLVDFISTLWNLCLNDIFPMKFLHKLIDSWMLFISLQLDLELNVFCQNPAFSCHVLQRIKLIRVSSWLILFLFEIMLTISWIVWICLLVCSLYNICRAMISEKTLIWKYWVLFF